jgi:hypothetical protein
VYYAECNNDITEAVRSFYMFDERKSTYSMETWLVHCGVSIQEQIAFKVVIIYKRKDKMFKSQLDLQNDIEMCTQSDISDVDLRRLPATHC